MQAKLLEKGGHCPPIAGLIVTLCVGSPVQGGQPEGGKTENPTRVDVRAGPGQIGGQRGRRQSRLHHVAAPVGLAGLSTPDHCTAAGRLEAGEAQGLALGLALPAPGLVPTLRRPGLCTVTEVPPCWRTPDQTERKGRMTEGKSKSRKGREGIREQRAGSSADSALLGRNNRALSLSSTPSPLSPSPQAPKLSSLTSPSGRALGQGEGRSRVSPLHAKQSQE